MRTSSISQIEWDEGGEDRTVWKFPEKNIVWGSKLIVGEYQVAALFTGHELFSKRLKMHDYFSKPGEYLISPNGIPLLVKAFSEAVSKTHLHCTAIYCSTKEHTYVSRIHTGDSFGQAYVHAEADMQCKFKIIKTEKFLKNVVADRKKTSNDKALGYLDKSLGDELFRQHPPYGWEPKQMIPLVEIWQNIGIELLSLKFEHYKQFGGGASA